MTIFNAQRFFTYSLQSADQPGMGAALWESGAAAVLEHKFCKAFKSFLK